jgi:hypothetical protein
MITTKEILKNSGPSDNPVIGDKATLIIQEYPNGFNL